MLRRALRLETKRISRLRLLHGGGFACAARRDLPEMWGQDTAMSIRESIENYIGYMMDGSVPFSIQRLMTLRRWLSQEDPVQLCFDFYRE